MRVAPSAEQNCHQQKAQQEKSKSDSRFHGFTITKRSAYGMAVTLENVAVFSVLELPEATAMPM